MAFDIEDVTAVIVNRRTLQLTRRCIESLRDFYPELRLLLIDNRSQDESTDYIVQLGKRDDSITTVINEDRTPHHATGLNLGYLKVSTQFFLTLDSDVEVLRGEWIEKMLRQFRLRDRMFAVGHVCLNAGPTCVHPPRPNERGHAFVHPFCALWDEEKFTDMGVWFQRSGAPTCEICRLATDSGYFLGQLPGIHARNEPIPYYVNHKWGGTRDKLAIEADRRRRLNVD